MIRIVRGRLYYDGGMSYEFIKIKIKRDDASFLRVALEERLRVWENTLSYEKTGQAIGEIEQASSAYEAEQMVLLWKEFIISVEKQIAAAIK